MKLPPLLLLLPIYTTAFEKWPEKSYSPVKEVLKTELTYIRVLQDTIHVSELLWEEISVGRY